MRRRRATLYCVYLFFIYLSSALINRLRSNNLAQNQNIGTSPAPKSFARLGYGTTLDARVLSTKRAAPRITLMTIWTPTQDDLEMIRDGKPPMYLATLFASVAANAHVGVELLLIVYDRNEVGCERVPFFAYPRPPSRNASDSNERQMETNIRQICLTSEEFWTLHADFLCDRWACEDYDKDALVWDLREQGVGQFDRANSFLRPLRGAIFARYMHPDTPIWGWCDTHVVLGSFERTFPFALVADFDMIVPARPAPMHEDISHVLLFLRGNLAFFRNSPRVADIFMRYDALKTLDTFFAWEGVSADAEEIEFSSYAFLTPHLTFLTLPAFADTRYTLASPSLGVYAVDESHGRRAIRRFGKSSSSAFKLLTLAKSYVREAVFGFDFSSKGVEYEVWLTIGVYRGYIWFPLEYAVSYATDLKRTGRTGRRYAMRRSLGGHITERVEYEPITPGPHPGSFGIYVRGQRAMEEYLYAQIDFEKGQDLNVDDLGETVLFIDREGQSEAWDLDGRPKLIVQMKGNG